MKKLETLKRALGVFEKYKNKVNGRDYLEVYNEFAHNKEDIFNENGLYFDLNTDCVTLTIINNENGVACLQDCIDVYDDKELPIENNLSHNNLVKLINNMENNEKELIKNYIDSKNLTITTQPMMNTKLKDVHCLDFVRLTDNIGLMFRYENTQDDRMNGYEVPMYRCVHILTNGDFGRGDFSTYEFDDKTLEYVESDWDEINEIVFDECEDNDTIGMLIIKHSGEILNAIIKWKDRELQKAIVNKK